MSQEANPSNQRWSEEVNAVRAKIALLGGYLWDRKLTDSAGGNISARVGEVICMSPAYSGSQRQWHLTPEDILVITPEGEILDGAGKISREAKVHLELHRNFKAYGSAVIHAHPRNLLVFAALNRPMPPVLEANLKFGTIPVSEYAPAHGQGLADSIVGAMRGNEHRITSQAAAVIAPYHGLFAMGKDLDATFDAVERIDNNAYITIMAQALGGTNIPAELEAAYAAAESK